MSCKDKEYLKYFDENPAFMDEQVRLGIETNRKGNASVQFVDAQGNPVTDVHVELRQETHDFRFGANIFMLDELETKEKNEQYKQLFAELFNQATLPFFWSDLEPVQGQPRYGKDSPKLYRRPSTDLCVEFCEEHGIEPKMHCLNYGMWTPLWVPQDVQGTKRCLEKHMAELGERYADRIPAIEVTNETLWVENWDMTSGLNTLFFHEPDYVEWSFEHARKHFPANELIINEAPARIWLDGFKYNRSAYYMLIERALSKGAPIDTIGMQFQAGGEPSPKLFDPVAIYQVLDQYAKLNKPIQISEVTIPNLFPGQEGEELQAELIEKLYQVWFSHPAMSAIIYWNVADGYAHGAEPGDLSAAENRYRGGLLNFDMSPKPAYTVLKKLIHETWKTNLSLDSGNGNKVDMRGFHGVYHVTASSGDMTAETRLHLVKGAENHFKITLG